MHGACVRRDLCTTYCVLVAGCCTCTAAQCDCCACCTCWCLCRACRTCCAASLTRFVVWPSCPTPCCARYLHRVHPQHAACMRVPSHHRDVRWRVVACGGVRQLDSVMTAMVGLHAAAPRYVRAASGAKATHPHDAARHHAHVYTHTCSASQQSGLGRHVCDPNACLPCPQTGACMYHRCSCTLSVMTG